jgi:plastocyanin
MRRYIVGVLAITALLLALTLTGCSAPSTSSTGGSSSSGSSSGGAAPSAVQVVLQNIAIQPANVTVAVGGTVTWANQDSVTHNLTDDAGSWSSGALAPGKSFSHTFTAAGTFPYHCIIHPSMTGQITVK